MVAPASKYNIRNKFCWLLLGSVFASSFGFTLPADIQSLAEGVKERLNAVYNPSSAGTRLRKFEIQISQEGFFRYRKTYSTGKSEYYSFSVSRLEEVSYLGTSTAGNLILKTTGDDIIVQTYNDPKGNVDSMTTRLIFPLKGVEAEDLQLISTNLRSIAEQLRARVSTTR